MENSKIEIRSATGSDVPLLHKLLIEHSRNHWSYPTDIWIAEHLGDIRTGKIYAILACENQNLIGAVIYKTSQDYLHYQTSSKEGTHGYISEVVVCEDHLKRGIGTALLRAAIEELMKKGMETIYAKRHEENAPSSRMMEKCGFTVIDTYHDPERTSGSRRTSICRLTVENPAKGLP